MQKTSFIFFATLMMGLLSLDAFAQTPPPPAKPPAVVPAVSPCPRLVIKNENPQFYKEGAPVPFVLEMSGGDPKVTPNILWTVSAGLITAGQGERRIEVDSSGAGAAGQMVAEVWVGGYPAECTAKASATARVVPPAMLLEKFGELPLEAENKTLDHAANYVAGTTDRLVVMVYSGRTDTVQTTNTAIRRIFARLTRGGLQGNRTSMVGAGYREKLEFELWSVPQGAEMPKPTPTIDRKDIAPPARATPTTKPGRPQRP